ncbi:MAG: diguanylate cyclase [Pirellulales bacterium]|nr:diguanylate cyclase [Pirellulales bacterium]
MTAQDRRLLRHLSKSLGAFGYSVQQAADWQQASAALDAAPPDVLIVDAEPNSQEALEFCGSADRQVRPQPLHTFLLVREPSPRQLTDALEAGVDDFLTKPIVYGELLARLRTAARVLEFERRVCRQGGRDPLTLLLSRTLFCDRLSEELSCGSMRRAPAVCILMDLDYLGRINYLYGHPAGDDVLRSVAGLLSGLCRQTDVLSSFGGGRFCTLLHNTSEDEAPAWTDRVRDALAETDFGLGDDSVRLTASFGVASVPREAQTPEEILDRAGSALEAAKTSGRDCTVRHGDFDGDAEAWADFAAPGKLFDRTKVRDIMTPCTLVLQGDCTVGQAAGWFQCTRDGALPVVDEQGKLAGLLFEKSIVDGPAGLDLASLRVADLVTTDVPVFEEDASFATLRDFLTRDSRSLIVIVDDEVPTGLVTPNVLAALSEPLTSESFAAAGPPGSASEYLLVPDLCPLDDAD